MTVRAEFSQITTGWGSDDELQLRARIDRLKAWDHVAPASFSAAEIKIANAMAQRLSRLEGG